MAGSIHSLFYKVTRHLILHAWKNNWKNSLLYKGKSDKSILYSKIKLMNKVVKEFAVSELPMKLYSLKDLIGGIDDFDIKISI